MWAFGRRHGTVHARRYAVSSYAGVWGWERLYTPLWLPSFVDAIFIVPFPFVCRGVACNILGFLLACGRSWWWCVAPSLPISCLDCCGGGIPFAPFCSLCKRVCGGGHSFSATPLGWLHTFVVAVIVVLFVAWRSAACNILALVFMCVRAFFTLVVPSYHVARPQRWWSCCACGSLLVRAYPSFPMCVACGGGHGHSWWRRLRVLVLRVTIGPCAWRHTFSSLCWRVGVGMVIGCTPLVTFVRCM